jgi:hypothetical protein
MKTDEKFYAFVFNKYPRDTRIVMNQDKQNFKTVKFWNSIDEVHKDLKGNTYRVFSTHRVLENNLYSTESTTTDHKQRKKQDHALNIIHIHTKGVWRRNNLMIDPSILPGLSSAKYIEGTQTCFEYHLLPQLSFYSSPVAIYRSRSINIPLPI